MAHCPASVRDGRFRRFHFSGIVGTLFIRRTGLSAFPSMTWLALISSAPAGYAVISRAVSMCDGGHAQTCSRITFFRIPFNP